MAFRKVFEGICEERFKSGKFSEEDDGQALIATLNTEFPENPESQMFVRVQSWDETGQHHEARQIEGKRIRVVIEEIVE
jgi:hypothetical protein